MGASPELTSQHGGGGRCGGGGGGGGVAFYGSACGGCRFSVNGTRQGQVRGAVRGGVNVLSS